MIVVRVVIANQHMFEHHVAVFGFEYSSLLGHFRSCPFLNTYRHLIRHSLEQYRCDNFESLVLDVIDDFSLIGR